MTYEDYDKTKLEIGQKLLFKGNPCVFDGYEECYGRILVRFDKPIEIRKIVASIASDGKIYTKEVGIEDVEKVQ